jgi:hypothetical protein
MRRHTAQPRSATLDRCFFSSFVILVPGLSDGPLLGSEDVFVVAEAAAHNDAIGLSSCLDIGWRTA